MIAQGGTQDDGLSKDAVGKSARSLRRLVAARVGSLDALRAPSTKATLPQPTLADGRIDPRYAITEAKRSLGELLFSDPVRTNRIRTDYGSVQSTAHTGSCGSCHLGEVAGKAGQVVNFNRGGEGRGYMDADGSFHVRRRLQPGFVDVIPTGQRFVSGGVVVRDGRFDAVDSVPRMSPSMLGFAFSIRLLLGGKAGEPNSPDNPHHLPTGENLAEIAFDAHRMLETQKDAVQQSRVYVKLFEDAFPAEATRYAASGDLDDLVNDDTIERAVATFLRTVVTRNTPWDRFLVGDNAALTNRQIRGAALLHGGARRRRGLRGLPQRPHAQHDARRRKAASSSKRTSRTSASATIRCRSSEPRRSRTRTTTTSGWARLRSITPTTSNSAR